LGSAKPDTTLWSLWAAKESAYKAAAKSEPAIHSVPRRYEVNLESGHGDGSARGVVLTPAGICHVRVFSCRDYVHCLASLESESHLDGITAGVFRWEGPTDGESVRAERHLTGLLSQYLELPQAAVRIDRRSSVPHVLVHGRPVRIDISMSHDGPFTACAFVLPEGI
jgi:hypothetical protein